MIEPASSSSRSKEPAPTPHLYELSLKNFRCFAHNKLEFVQPTALIIGFNGAGKTSLLEAIYYASYSNSFRTRSSSQMIKEGADALSVKLKLQGRGGMDEILIGYQPRKKLIKINGQAVKSHSEISKYFNCISLTQEDIGIVTDGPDRRRTFLNQSHYIFDPTGWSVQARQYKKILEQRNALLQAPFANQENFKIWTDQHWQLTKKIQLWRQGFIKKLSNACEELVNLFLPEIASKVQIDYKPAVDCTQQDFKIFFEQGKLNLFSKEQIMKRSMFGAHLDDFTISMRGMCARSFASRGEQKLLTLLIKCAGVKVLESAGLKVNCILIDDFLTDLDKGRVEKCQNIIDQFGLQTIITMPILRRDLFPKAGNCQEILFS